MGFLKTFELYDRRFREAGIDTSDPRNRELIYRSIRMLRTEFNRQTGKGHLAEPELDEMGRRYIEGGIGDLRSQE